MVQSAFIERRRQPEIMDRPDLAMATHRRALSGLRRLNVASGVCRQIWKPIVEYARSRRLARLRMLDIASGGGDVALGLWKLARRQGVELEILGVDISSTACDFAGEKCRPADGAIGFKRLDVFGEVLPTGFDVVTCSLFLHHLSFGEAVNLLERMAAAGRLLVVNDLRRCAAGYALAQVACHLFTMSTVVRCDGPQSVANAFTAAEMRRICAEAGLAGATIRRVWPYRLLMIHQGS